jgi:hypothetical protein
MPDFPTKRSRKELISLHGKQYLHRLIPDPKGNINMLIMDMAGLEREREREREREIAVSLQRDTPEILMETGWSAVRACRDWSSATGASSAATGSDGTPFSRTTVINLFLTARKVKSQFQSPKLGKI